MYVKRKKHHGERFDVVSVALSDLCKIGSSVRAMFYFTDKVHKIFRN